MRDAGLLLNARKKDIFLRVKEETPFPSRQSRREHMAELSSRLACFHLVLLHVRKANLDVILPYAEH